MLQFLLMLLSLASPNNNIPAPVNHPTTISTYSMNSGGTGDTGGDNGHIPPKK